MDRHITRPILWNVPIAFQVILYGLFLGFCILLAWSAWRWYRIVRLGQPADRGDHRWRRLALMLRDAFGQGTVVREPWGWMHYALYAGFVGLFIGTNIVLLNSDISEFFGLFGLGFYFYYGAFYHVFKAAMDTFFVLVIVGVLAAGIRRIVQRPAPLKNPPPEKLRTSLENRLGYRFPLAMLALVPLTGLMLEGARINANPPQFVEWAYIGRESASMEGALGAGAMFHRYCGCSTSCWCTGCCLPAVYEVAAFLIAPVNVYFRNLGPAGVSRRSRILKMLRASASRRSSNTRGSNCSIWPHAWNAVAARSIAPPFSTGKALNPKLLVMSQREHLLDKAPTLLATAALAAKANGDAHDHSHNNHAHDQVHDHVESSGDGAGRCRSIAAPT